uniref:IlGF domain-containing protein n=1 Tax=Bursaphelenchus xylophilus TaxID=6326 RepID=A0A1I7RPW0_BURXY
MYLCSPSRNVVLFLILVVFTTARETHDDNRNLVRYCGKLLLNVMARICNHRYIMPNKDALQRPKRRTGGLASQCCTNKCTMGYLKSFCATD